MACASRRTGASRSCCSNPRSTRYSSMRKGGRRVALSLCFGRGHTSSYPETDRGKLDKGKVGGGALVTAGSDQPRAGMSDITREADIRGHGKNDANDPKRTFAPVATAFPTARSAAPEHHYVRSSGGVPKLVERSHVSIEQVAIAAVETLDDSVAAVSAATRRIVAGILPEPPATLCPGLRDRRRLMVVDNPKAAAREYRAGRDPHAAVGPGRMRVDERQPAISAGYGLHERLGLFQRHGIRGVAFIGLDIQREESLWAGAGRVQKEGCLLRAR